VVTGSVILTDGGTMIGTYELTPDGKVSIATGGASGFSFTPGMHSLIASYSGDASFQPGTSAAFAFSVNKGAPIALQVGGLFGTQAQASAILTNLPVSHSLSRGQ
jgi:hypothetical protein